MLKLINLKMNENIIEADYIPEQSNEKAHISLNVLTDEHGTEKLEGYGSMYARMALSGLRRTLEELESGKISEVPKERTVMWY